MHKHIQWGKKVFSQPPIVQILPLKKMREGGGQITGLSHLFMWENLHNWWLTKYFFASLYVFVHVVIFTFHPKYSYHMAWGYESVSLMASA